MTEGSIVDGADMPAQFAEHTRVLLAHCGCLAIKGADNRLQNKGTATFVHHGTRRLIFTANHVATALEAAAGRTSLQLPLVTAAGEFQLGVPSPPTELTFHAQVIWRDVDHDAAILAADVVPVDQVRWFDMDAAVTMTKKVREVWRPFSADGNGSLPFAICGYAEWGHIRISDAMVEIVSALPLFSYITEWDDPDTGKSAQIYLEIEARSRPPEELEGLSDLHLQMVAQMSRADSPFGGYSGGPLALFDTKGVHLIGIVKEGGFTFGEPRGFCSALDDIARLSAITK